MLTNALITPVKGSADLEPSRLARPERGSMAETASFSPRRAPDPAPANGREPWEVDGALWSNASLKAQSVEPID
jgi:hypothetical protein